MVPETTSVATFLEAVRQIEKKMLNEVKSRKAGKKIAILLFVTSAIISCNFPGGSISIKHSQYDHYYEMTAKFNPGKTGKVDRYLDKGLPSGNMSFVNIEMDGDIILDNKTTFYIKKSPGYLNIKFDKEKNSEEAFTKIKSVLEGINDVVR